MCRVDDVEVVPGPAYLREPGRVGRLAAEGDRHRYVQDVPTQGPLERRVGHVLDATDHLARVAGLGGAVIRRGAYLATGVGQAHLRALVAEALSRRKGHRDVFAQAVHDTGLLPAVQRMSQLVRQRDLPRTEAGSYSPGAKKMSRPWVKARAPSPRAIAPAPASVCTRTPDIDARSEGRRALAAPPPGVPYRGRARR